MKLRNSRKSKSSSPQPPLEKKRTVRAEDRDCALTIAINLNEAVTICINGHNSESEGVWAQGGEKEVPLFLLHH